MIKPNAMAFLGSLIIATLVGVSFEAHFIFIFFLLLSFLCAYTVLKRKEDIFAPWNIFLFIWLFAVGVCSLQITVYESPWEPYTWLAVLLGILAFLFPCFVLYVLNRERSDLKDKFKNIRSRLGQKWDPLRFYLTIIPIFSFSLLIFIYQYIKASVIPLFASMAGMTIDYARGFVAINSFTQRIALTQVPVFMATFMFIISHAKRKAGKIALLIATISFLAIVSYSSRLFLGTAVVTSLIGYHYLRKDINLNSAMVAGLLIVVLIVMTPIYIRGVLSKNYLEDIGFRSGYTWAAPLYLGISMNYFVLEKLIERTNSQGFTYGWMSIYPIRALFSEKERALDAAKGLTPGAEWMTTTILGDFYSDFGYFGVIVGMFCIGLLCSFVYFKMLAYPTPFTVCWHSYNMWYVIFSIYANGFIIFDYIWNLLVIFLISMIASHFRIDKILNRTN
jgi:oligosaccharide repeat unit polymerase